MAVDVIRFRNVKGDGLTDDTAQLQAVFSAAGQEIYFPSATYKVSGTITIPANTSIAFDNAIFKVDGPVAGGIFSFSASHIRVRGRYTVQGGNFKTPFWKGSSGGDYFDHQAHVDVSGISHNLTANDNNYFICLTQCNWANIAGPITTTDSLMVKSDRGSHIYVAGVNAGPYTVNNGSNGIVHLGDLTGGVGGSDITVFDCHIDGGGILSGYAGIVVGQSSGGSTHTNLVKVSSCSVASTTGGADGIDFVQADQVACSDCHVSAVNNGIDVAACNYATVTNCTASSCRSAGFQCGDVTVAFSTNICTYTNCIVTACGIGGQVDFTAAGFVVFAPAGSSTNLITLKNCISYYGSNANMKYGYGFGNGAGGTFSNVYIEGGFVLGGTAPYLDSATVKPAAIMKNIAGLNPQGTGVTTPGFPGSTVNVTNSTGFDCMVTVVNGTSAMTNISVGNQTITGSLPASATLSFTVPAGFPVKFTYGGGTPSWIWYGL